MRATTLKCKGCGCTTDRACPGGCSWASVNPPKCSACVDNGRLKISASDHAPDENFCYATPDSTHTILWLTRRTGVCTACKSEFIATAVA